MHLQAAAIDRLLHYDDEYQVLICTAHGYAIRNLDLHLRDEHAVPSAVRRIIAEKHASQPLAEPKRVRQPPPGPPFDVLRPPVDALLCAEPGCGFASIQLTSVRSHCNKIHNWRSTRQSKTYWTSIKAQTFFTSGGLQRYFAVEPDPDNAVSDGDTNTEDECARWEAKRLELKKAEQERMKAMPGTDRTGWYSLTGWPEHLVDSDYKKLSQAIRLPSQGEARLQKAAKAVQALIEQGVAGLRTLARDTRCWLRSAKREGPDTRPLGRLQNAESQTRYARYWAQFVCYCLRVATDAAPEDARRLFVWQGCQRELTLELWQSLDANSEDDHIQKILALSAAFLFTSVGNEPFKSGLVHFMAVLGIDADRGRLRMAEHYSYMLAGVMYCIRVTAVEALLPAAGREEQGDAEREAFLEKRRDFLSVGSYSATSAILHMLAYGKSITRQTGSAGNTIWSTDGRILYLHGEAIVIKEFRGMVHAVVRKAERMLWRELMWTDRFEVDLDAIVDDVHADKYGDSFVGNVGGNRLPPMVSRAKKRLKRGCWDERRVRKYLRRVDAFLELLLFAIHMTGGQPARGTEITSVRHCNGQFQDRNIYIMAGQAVVITRYHKSQSQYDTPRIVSRFLPWRVGQLLAVYLLHVLPLREHLETNVLSSFKETGYLWGSGDVSWTSDRLTQVLERETQKRLATCLGIRRHRHAAVSIGRRVVGEAFAQGYQDEIDDDDAEMDEDESPLELQAGRRTATGGAIYGVSANLVMHLSERALEIFRQLSEKWHRFLGFDSRRPDSGWGDGGWSGPDSSSRSRSQSRSQSRSRSRSRSRNQSQRQSQSRSQTQNQNQSQSQDSGRTKRARDGELDQPSKRRRVTYSNHNIQQAMQHVLGRPEVAFRSPEQERAMHDVLDGRTPLVVILPTGGGKSLLFMVPACLEADAGGVTVVVVPLRALVNDLLQRLRKARVDHLEWQSHQTNAAAVVVVSADVASSSEFMTYMRSLAERGRLRRIVIDECHLTLTASDWRPKLAQLRVLRALGCQMVLLTATLPPVLEANLSEAMLVRNATYVRASTVRPNIRYTVSPCPRGQLVPAALAVCRRQQPEQRGVVYCRSKAQCETIAGELGCSFYHADVLDRAERLEAWIAGGGFIVATSALGTGVDIGGIEFVLHVDAPWGMIDYAQESGRAGRSGELADSIILVEEHKLGGRRQDVVRVSGRAVASVKEVDAKAIAAFLNAHGCRRAVMSCYLDGAETQCAEAMCDLCGDNQAEWEDEQRQAARQWAVVRPMLDDLRDGCAVCWVLDDGDHVRASCQREEITNAELDEFRKGIRYDGPYACFKCGLEQRMCGRGDDSSAPCKWPNVLVPVVRAALADQECGPLIRQLGYKGKVSGRQGLAEYAVWLGKAHTRRLWGQLVSNGMAVMVRVILHLAEDEED
jgi:superfamily II DNA/RNA helicase